MGIFFNAFAMHLQISSNYNSLQNHIQGYHFKNIFFCVPLLAGGASFLRPSKVRPSVCPTVRPTLCPTYAKCVICPTYTQNASFVRPIHKMRHLSDLTYVQPPFCPTCTQNASFVRPTICPTRNLSDLKFFLLSFFLSSCLTFFLSFFLSVFLLKTRNSRIFYTVHPILILRVDLDSQV